MRHVTILSIGQTRRSCVAIANKGSRRGWNVGSSPVLADAKGDLLNALYAAWLDYQFAKKNQATT